VSGRRPIRVICTPPPTSRRVPYTCGQTVVAVSEDTGYTIRLENVGARAGSRPTARVARN
jgi:hypothetical protein